MVGICYQNILPRSTVTMSLHGNVADIECVCLS